MFTGHIGETLSLPVRLETLDGTGIESLTISNISVDYADKASVLWNSLDPSSVSVTELGSGDYTINIFPEIVVNSGFFRAKVSAGESSAVDKQYVVNVESSSLVFENGIVYVDRFSSLSGTAYPNGTATYPVNNLDDAILIANNNNVRRIDIVTASTSVNTLSVNPDYMHITGIGGRYSDEIFITAAGTAPVFENLAISGQPPSASTSVKFIECYLKSNITISFDDNKFNHCVFGSILSPVTIYPNDGLSRVHIYDSTMWATIDCVSVSLGGPGEIVNSGGDLTFKNMTASGNIYIYGFTGRIIVDSSCTNGNIYVYNLDGQLLDSASGTNIYVEPRGFENAAVYIDQNSPYSGTDSDIGTPTKPVNNYADAKLIATNNNIQKIIFSKTANTTISGAPGNSTLESLASPFDTTSCNTISNGCYADTFRRLRIGTAGNQFVRYSIFDECAIANGTSVDNAIFKDCVIESLLSVTLSNNKFMDCQFVPGSSLMIQHGGSMFNCCGEVTIKEMDNTGDLYVYGFRGKLIRGASSTGGTIYVIGGSVYVDQTSGSSTVTILPEDPALTAQEVRDSMLLSPSAAYTVGASIDGLLYDLPSTINGLLSSSHGIGDWSAAGTLTMQSMRDAMLLSPSAVPTIGASIDWLLNSVNANVTLIATSTALSATTIGLTATTIGLDYTLDQSIAATLSLVSATTSLNATTIGLVSATVALSATTIGLDYAVDQAMSTTIGLTATTVGLDYALDQLVATTVGLSSSTVSLIATTVGLDYALDQTIATTVGLTATTISSLSTTVGLISTTVGLNATTIGLDYALDQVMAVTIANMSSFDSTSLNLMITTVSLIANTVGLDYALDQVTATTVGLSASTVGLVSNTVALTATTISLIQSTTGLIATTVGLDYALDQSIATTVGLSASTVSLIATTIGSMSDTIGLVSTTVGLTATTISLMATTTGLTATTVGLDYALDQAIATTLALSATTIELTATTVGLDYALDQAMAVTIGLSSSTVSLIATTVALNATTISLDYALDQSMAVTIGILETSSMTSVSLGLLMTTLSLVADTLSAVDAKVTTLSLTGGGYQPFI